MPCVSAKVPDGTLTVSFELAAVMAWRSEQVVGVGAVQSPAPAGSPGVMTLTVAACAAAAQASVISSARSAARLQVPVPPRTTFAPVNLRPDYASRRRKARAA